MESRFTKIGLAIAFCAFALTVLPTQSAAQGLTDLSMRRALYFTGAKTSKIDTRGTAQGGDPYVVANGGMTLKKSQATKCEADGCYFNFGFFITRTPSAGSLSTYGLIQIAGGGLVGNELQFADNVGSHQHVLPIKLANGVHKLRITVDPYAKTQESDENNNTFTVTIVVRN